MGNNIIITGILIGIFPIVLFGQSEKIDVGLPQENDNKIPVEDSASLSEAYFKKGITLSLIYQNYTEGINSFTIAIDLNSSNPLAFYNRGYAYMKTKQFDKAISDLQKSIQMQPQNYRAYLNLGKCYTSLEKFEDAIAIYQSGLQYNNEYAPLYFNIGIAYHKSGKFHEALNTYTKAIEIDNTKAKYYFNRGLAKQEHLNVLAGITDLEKASELEPENTKIHYAIGFAYLNLGYAQKALESFTEVIEIDSTFWKAYFNRALVNMELLDFANAKSDLRLFTEHHDNDPLGFFYAGKSELELGENYQALKDFERAVELDPQFGWANYYLGYVMINSFGKFEGCQYLQKALDSGIDEAKRTLDIACVNK